MLKTKYMVNTDVVYSKLNLDYYYSNDEINRKVKDCRSMGKLNSVSVYNTEQVRQRKRIYAII